MYKKLKNNVLEIQDIYNNFKKSVFNLTFNPIYDNHFI